MVEVYNMLTSYAVSLCTHSFVITVTITVDCPVGTYSVEIGSKSVCMLCQKGTFADKVGQSQCLSCPQNKSTLDAGSLSIQDCIGLLHYKFVCNGIF